MKRYSIMAQQTVSEVETEVCQVDSDPEPIVKALREKTTRGRRHLPIYATIRVIDRQAAE